jgi:hypothetical protein
MTNPQKIEKWANWIEDIRWQTVRLMDYRRWNEVYERVVNANPRLRPGTPVLDYFRLVRRSQDSITLTGLLDDLKINAQMLTREWHRKMYRQPLASGTTYSPDFADQLSDSDFKKFADPSGKFVDSALIAADLNELESKTDRIVHVSDREIAHNDKRGLGHGFAPTTFDELNAAILSVESTTRRYSLLLTGASPRSMTPIDQTDSVRVFTFPWIEPDNRPDLGDLN